MSALKSILQLLRGADPGTDWHATEPWVRTGTRLLVVVVGGLLAWSLVVSIAGAVVASGRVAVEGNYKAVQHLDGGIVAEIRVRDGDRVATGDVLIRLDDTAARAQRDTTRAKLDEQLVQRARLEAERDGAAAFAAPLELAARTTEPGIVRLLDAQRALFSARKAAQDGERAMLGERVRQLEREAKGLEALARGRRAEAALNDTEVANLTPLQRKGIVSQQRMTPLLRDKARLAGDVGRLDAEVARTMGAIAEARLKLAQAHKDTLQSIVDELRKVDAAIAELTESDKALAARLERTLIRATDSGRVHALAVHTIGGVVTPASVIAQIVPEASPLRVEAQLPPKDIDKVHEGQTAGVLFPAFNARATPRLDGIVVRVSPAQLTDAQGRAYFTADIELPHAEIARLGTRHRLVPGMPAEVFIETESRSILSYFLKPLTDAVTRAFREA